MAVYDSLMRGTLGAAALGTADFQLDDYARTEEAEIKEGQGRTGTNVSIKGEGFVDGATAEAFATALGAVAASFRVSGQDFKVWGLGGFLETQLLAAECFDGGPHASFEMLANKGGSALSRRFRFTVEAKVPAPSTGSSSTPTNTYKRSIATRPDGLRLFSYQGQIKGKGTTGAQAYFYATVLPAIAASFPPAFYVPTTRYEANLADDVGDYTLEFRELRDLLPGPIVGASVADGQIIERFERDEQYRLVRVVQFEFLIVGDPVKMKDHIRGLFAETPLRENYEVTYHPETRVRGEFASLASASMDDLLDWEMSLECTLPQTVLKAWAVPGGKPVVYRLPAEPSTYLETGRAVGRQRYPKPPAALSSRMNAAPKVSYRRKNDVEFETSWTRSYMPKTAFEISGIFLAKLTRPVGPASPPSFEATA